MNERSRNTGITIPPSNLLILWRGLLLVAAKREGFNYIGIERETEYVEIAKARVGVG